MAEKGLEIVVKFPEEVPLAVQGEFLLSAELMLRNKTGLDVRVVKALQGDDSRLRVMMSPEMRAKL